jgi:HD-like signal output (HDOD) protein
MIVHGVAPQRDLLERLLEQSESLPLGNRAALSRIASLCSDPSASAQGVALEAARDEGFAALLIRLANSAHSASIARVSELTTAVTRLGFRFVQGLAIAAPGLRLLAGPNDGLGPARQALHRHAVRTGLAARMLAAAEVDPEQALAAGLLQNVGLNVLSLCEPELFRLALGAAAGGQQLREIEEILLGFTHAELGARLAERWSYPLPLATAILEHDADAPSTPLAAIVQVADRLVREAGIGVEAPVEPTSAAVDLACIGDLDAARERLRLLLDAQERFDSRLAAESLDALV